MPNLGMVEYLEEHLPQKICPHARQWCCEIKRDRCSDAGYGHADGLPARTPYVSGSWDRDK